MRIMGWWVASEKVWCLRKIRYSPPAFGYILWKVMSTMGWWFASEEGMVPLRKVMFIPLLLVTFCGRWWVPRFVSCIWGRYGALRKVRYSTPAFGYILWKVISTMGWWVASEEGMVPCVRLVALPLLLVTFCGSWRAPLVGELNLRKVWCPA